jgi:hypothetical protein
MLFLVLFSTLALGFYSAVNTSAIVSENDHRGVTAAMSAESGMEFVRYQMSQLDIPHGTAQAQIFSKVYDQLATLLNGTSNLKGGSIATTGTLISIPALATNYINLDSSGAQFRCTLEDLGQKIQVTVWGRGQDPRALRAVQMKYDLAQKASAVFNYGVASKGTVTTGGAAQIIGATDPTRGSVLSTNMTDPVPVTINGQIVSGDISISNPAGNVSFKSGVSIGGTTDPTTIINQHIHTGVTAPQFPTIDTDAFKAYATNTYVSGETLVNTTIGPGSYKFTGNTTITGVLYVKGNTKIDFAGNTSIQGVIVVENSAPGTLSTNQINFTGSVAAQGVQTLPATYGNLRQLTGAFLLAPNFAVSFSGDFGTVSGSIVADKVTMGGNAHGTISGSVINNADNPMVVNGSSDIIIASTGTTNYPAGVFFSSRYVPLADTYEEIHP